LLKDDFIPANLRATREFLVSSPCSPLAISLAAIAHEAGRVILRHYAENVESRTKADSSPVTAADEEAEALILARLKALAPDIPVIAEETMAAGKRPEIGARFFLVDPLDGTKEFLNHNGEFTVNIALIEDRKPVCGVVLAPARADLFIGDGAHGAFRTKAPEDLPLNLESAQRIHVRTAPESGLIAVASRSHRDYHTEDYLARHKVADLVAAGSSLKFCLIAAGEADLYPRLGRTMEWDVAAGHAVLAAAGGYVTTLDGAPFLYGKVEDGFANPFFVAFGDGVSV
jgi:3'(2'), 5'-bisphosphate nucleotidase